MSANAWTRPVFNLDAAAWRGIRSRNREPIARGLALRFYLAGSALSALDALQKRIYRRVLDGITTRPPVFLVGYWRSGTTLLHELLALDDCFAAPSTYQCFNPHRFLLTVHRAPGENRVVRPAGDMTVSPSSPQEEEFALLCMGAISPYEAFMFPGAFERFEMLMRSGLVRARTAASMERGDDLDIESHGLRARSRPALAAQISG